MNVHFGYQMSSEIAGFLTMYLIIWLLLMGFSIVTYVFSSLGTYTIAKRRELNHPWMAWVPVLNMWILGSISDQYRYVTQGKVRNKRKWLVGLQAAYFAVMLIFYVVMLLLTAGMVSDTVGGVMQISDAVGIVIAFFSVWLVLVGIIIAMCVVRYMALYDLYKSCMPDNAVLFLVLSILVSMTEPFFLFACRKKDEGMPPRRSRPNAYFPEQPDPQPQQAPSAQPVAHQPPEASAYTEPEDQPPVYQPEPPVCQPDPAEESREWTPAEPADPIEVPEESPAADPWDLQ